MFRRSFAMSKTPNKFVTYNTLYTLAPGDSITFCCSKVSDGKVLGKSITNTFPVAMGVAYYDSKGTLELISLSGDSENIDEAI